MHAYIHIHIHTHMIHTCIHTVTRSRVRDEESASMHIIQTYTHSYIHAYIHTYRDKVRDLESEMKNLQALYNSAKEKATQLMKDLAGAEAKLAQMVPVSDLRHAEELANSRGVEIGMYICINVCLSACPVCQCDMQRSLPTHAAFRSVCMYI